MSLKCIVFLYVIKYIIVNDCFVICVGSSSLSKTVDVTVRRKKTFQSHLLTSDENQEIIRKPDVESWRKAKLAEAKAEAYKKFLENEKEKKKELAKKRK